MWRVPIILLVACHHDPTPAPSLPDGTPDSVVDAPSFPLLSVGPFTPQPCTGGLPSTPTCPINVIELDGVGAVGGTFEFVAQALGSGTYLSDVAFVAGPVGIHVENVEVFVVASGTVTSSGTFEVVLDVLPGERVGLSAVALVGFDPTDQLLLRFDAITPLP